MAINGVELSDPVASSEAHSYVAVEENSSKTRVRARWVILLGFLFFVNLGLATAFWQVSNAVVVTLICPDDELSSGLGLHYDNSPKHALMVPGYLASLDCRLVR